MQLERLQGGTIAWLHVSGGELLRLSYSGLRRIEVGQLQCGTNAWLLVTGGELLRLSYSGLRRIKSWNGCSVAMPGFT